MNIYGDYHTHTKYSDGRTSCRENVEAAIEKGLREIAITDHGFHNARVGSIRMKGFLRQREEIAALREEFSDKISILQGIEANITSADGTVDLTPDECKLMDVIVMGFHPMTRPKTVCDYGKVFITTYISKVIKPPKSVIKRNTKSYIESLKRYPIDILAHINHSFQVDAGEIAKACADYGTYLELNMKHFNVFTDEMFENMLKTDVEFIINSDAHTRAAIGKFDAIEAFLAKFSFDEKRIANLERTPVFKKK